ncbi:hypothetical protein AC578_10459 [Pseudocercospora eumusae]|uniref:Uncharacterized protein n=1 Tax=Pseudocercospora eumusae TaxID=321146 RepID=A0A139GUK3_9PEZI|nr:hypothetical protein AC578_10459 [Pseudocercospora eumusae]
MPVLEIFAAQAIIGLTLFGYAWLGRKRELEDWSKLVHREPWPQHRTVKDDLKYYARKIEPASLLSPLVHDGYPFGPVPEVRAYYARLNEQTALRPASTLSGLALGASSLPPAEPYDDGDSDHEHNSMADDSGSEASYKADEFESDVDDDEKKRRKKCKKEKQKAKAKRMKKPYHKKRQPTGKELKHGKGQHRRPGRSGLRGGGGDEEMLKYAPECYDGIAG